MDDTIRKRRILLGNPYAFLNGEGGFDASVPDHLDDAIRKDREQLLNQYAFLNGEGGFDASVPARRIDSDNLLGRRRRGEKFSKPEIATIVRRLHGELWHRRQVLRPGRKLLALDLLDPALAFSTLGFVVEANAQLGEFEEHGERFQVAGLLDRTSRLVRISDQFPPHVCNFTLAHELAHAVLHQGAELHRDRALDGSAGNRSSDPIETEANHFAVLFLMPEKQIRAAFRERFSTENFVLSEATAFALQGESVVRVRRGCGQTLRTLSRALASVDYYDGTPCEPLAAQFRVSAAAMAIRLEEIGLVRDPSLV
jgi:hypothetical protein